VIGADDRILAPSHSSGPVDRARLQPSEWQSDSAASNGGPREAIVGDQPGVVEAIAGSAPAGQLKAAAEAVEARLR
jgi:hypothetical protein